MVNYLDIKASRRTVERSGQGAYLRPQARLDRPHRRPCTGAVILRRHTRRRTLAFFTSRPSRYPGGITLMTEAQQMARRALQESMDLRDQGHSDD